MGNMSIYPWSRAPVTAVIIPCYQCEKSIQAVIQAIPDSVHLIICVDDGSDDETLNMLHGLATLDTRITYASHESRQGKGAAMVTGLERAIELGAEILVQLDCDGRMNPELIDMLIAPIAQGEADYTKANRYFDLQTVRQLPARRLMRNAGLSLMAKLSTGYWNLLDPTSEFTAIHAEVAKAVPLDELETGDLFEQDLLFHLATLRARVVELPIAGAHGDAKSSPRPMTVAPYLHARNFVRRIGYGYIMRGFNAASLNLLIGLPLLLIGSLFGAFLWNTQATAGTMMLSAVPLLIGAQMLSRFLQHDVAAVPRRPIHRSTAGQRMMDSALADIKRLRSAQDRNGQADLSEISKKLERTIH